ncbi:ABC transporter ATP-binding protein [Promicromonospora sukumoe]|uniref:ATP-binding cassette subfamily B protein n=1 Tax=Promicromonospora sukumoe TaxID=88382 RepID=A0A7W3J8F8_9MICO|nr:ABC transporter ATP-binding protein [Promicromonospora sukumoe]MBA8808114.1 ATP-binding cassette subfamily B protein [Promicromonospora sukumoe]
MPPTDERSNRSDPSSDPSSPPGAERSTFASVRRLYPYVRPAMPRLVGGLLASLGASLMALAIPRVLQWVTDGPLTTGAEDHDWTGLAWSVVLVALLGVGEAGLILLRRTLVMFPGTRVEAVMRMALFKHLQDLPIAFHDRWPGGQLLSRIMGDLGLLRRWLVFGILQLVVSFVTIVVGVGLLVVTGGWLGIIFLCGAIPVTILAFRFSRKYRKISRLSQDQSGDLATTVEESVHGIRVLKAFGRGPDALDSFTDQASELRETEIRKATTDAGLTTALRVIPEVTQAVALVAGVYLVAQGDMTLGALVAFFATTAVINGPVVDLGMTLSMTLNARTAVDRFFEVIETVNPLTDPSRSADLPPATGETGGHVAFRNVTFRYDDAERPVLDQVDLELPPGTTTALVGLTGSGKSTLAMLPPRLFDVTAGVVEVDGVDVRDMTRAQVRERVAVAFEDPTLFSASVRDNVLLGVPDGLPEAEREALMTQALEVAQAQFVLDLPDGVGTRIGEEGLSLSGGQRQRLALARAIAARPRVLVLDDPLSALDVTTEEAVTARLRDVLGATTSLIIAHRPSTVALADRVAVLQGGRITAVGTHHDLLATDPHYRYIISSLEQDYEAHDGENHAEQGESQHGQSQQTESQEALS